MMLTKALMALTGIGAGLPDRRHPQLHLLRNEAAKASAVHRFVTRDALQQMRSVAPSDEQERELVDDAKRIRGMLGKAMKRTI